MKEGGEELREMLSFFDDSIGVSPQISLTPQCDDLPMFYSHSKENNPYIGQHFRKP